MKINAKDIILSIILIALAIFTRTIWHIAPNIELVTSVSLLGGYFLRQKKFAVLIPLFILGISDMIIGNTNIAIFTWSAFLLAPFIGILFNKMTKAKTGIIKKVLSLEVGGIFSVIIFFLWTNLGVVLVTPMYSKDLAGVISSYVAGLPFVANQFLGTIIAIPVLALAIHYYYKFDFSKLTLVRSKLLSNITE